MRNLLDGPRLFLRIVERGSLKAVAEDLETDPANVTRRLSALEARLGVKLLDRSRRGVQATEAGTVYYRRMREILPDVDALEAEIAGVKDIAQGLVRVSCPVDLGARYVTSWVVALQEQHPDLEVELLLSDQFMDLAGNSIDVALRIGALSDSELIAKRIATMKLVIVAAPAYLDRATRPSEPRDLETHRFVLYSWMQFGRTAPLVSEGKSPQVIALNSKLSVNNVGAIRQAVLSGAGVHIGPEWIFAEDLKNGRLENVLPGWAPAPTPVYALHRPGPFLPAKTRVVLDMLGNRLRDMVSNQS